MQEPSLLSLSGFILTFFIDLVNRFIKDSDMRRGVAYLICTIWGSVINVIEHNGNYFGMSWSEIAISFLVTIGATIGFSQLTYKSFWEDSKIRTDLQLNAKTLQ